MSLSDTDYTSLSSQPRFFVAPRKDIFDEIDPLETKLKQRQTDKSPANHRTRTEKMRYAAYVRISSEEQVGNFSLDAQERAIQTWVAAKNGLLVEIYKDEAQSAKTADRPAFQRMRRDARKGKFDAVIVHKFDRFARNRTDSLAIKSLLRYDYGIKVFSVSEPSEDSDGPMGALIEGIMESVADWYSRNLSAETSKGKKERALQGYHNNIAPFGYAKDDDKVLIPDEKELTGLKLAFESYATNQFSDLDIAKMLNDRGFKTRKGRPMSKDTVRDFLQNQIYLGKVSYQPFKHNADGSRSRTTEVEWFEGKHEAIVSQELFDQCQEVRKKRVSHRQPTIKYNPYLLRNLVYCYDCCSTHPGKNAFPSYGKMRSQAYDKDKYRVYRCRAREMGYSCNQKKVHVEKIDQQVLDILMHLKPPVQWRKRITESLGELLGEKDLQQRLDEITIIIKRMDTRWDMGFITDEQEYINQRLKLQQELERLTPVDKNDLERAADLLNNFKQHWAECGSNTDAQAELVSQVVERVYVQDEKVMAMTLRSNCHLVLGHKINGPTEYTVDPFISQSAHSLEETTTDACGDDGI